MTDQPRGSAALVLRPCDEDDCPAPKPHTHDWPMRLPVTPPENAAADAWTVVDVHREVALAQLQVAHEALYQALLWSILPAGQGSVLTGPQAESLAFAKGAVVQLRREIVEARDA